jgi:hypothetical protein
MSEEIDRILGKLWESTITSFQFDFSLHQLKLELVAIEGGKQSKYAVIFGGVSAFFFVNGQGEKRFDLSDWNYAELSEIYHFDHKEIQVNTITTEKGFYPHSVTPNIFIESWSSNLFIEAKSVSINDDYYDLT